MRSEHAASGGVTTDADLGVRPALERLLARQAAVADFGQRALAQTHVGRLLDEAVNVVGETLHAQLVSLLELQPDGEFIKLVAGSGWRDGLIGQLTLGTDTGSMAGYTLATGGPVIVDDFGRERRFAIAEALVDHGAVAGLSVRIGDGDRPFGALAAFSGRAGDYTHDDAIFLQAVANVIAGAIARVRIESELRRSRDELAAIVSGVTDGITVQDRQGRLAFANDAAARLTGYNSAAELLAAPVHEVMSRFELLQPDGRPMPFGDLPGRRVLDGEPAAEALVRFRVRATGDDRWSVVEAAPIRGDDGSVVQAINIFRDVTPQKRTEIARAFLSEALAATASTLDTAETARRLAEACVPALADCCLIDLVESDGTLHSAAIVHAEAPTTRAVRRARDRMTLSAGDESPLGSVVRTGRSRQGSAAELGLSPATSAHDARYVSVPLLAHERAIGAITLVYRDRRLTTEQLDVVKELGVRAGPAIENARLYQAVSEQRAELDAVLAAMADAVLVFGPRGQLRLANAAADRLFAGRAPETIEALQERLWDDAEHPSPAVPNAGEPPSEVRLRDTGRWLEVRQYGARPRGAPGSQRQTTAVIVLRDVTDARVAAVARDAFMGVLSHELRTPITTIYGGSQLLERGIDEDRRAEVTSDIKAEAERLARLVEDLLVLTRAERGGVDIGDDPVLLQRLIPQLRGWIEARWPGMPLDLELDESLPAVSGDVTYLEQVLRNLVTNAVRYGQAQSLGLTLRVADQGTDVVVAVLDRGPGLADEDPERLFELFYRASSAQSVPGGAGIGLFVCRQLVEAMGGRIWARPRKDGGAEFGFTLPVVDADVS